MMTQEEMHLYDFMVEEEIATAEELNLARNLVDGSWKHVLESVLYIRTGYHTLEQYLNEEIEEEDFTLEDIEAELPF